MWNILVRVRLKSHTVHSKFSTVQAGFSLACVDQVFVSCLCKLLVIVTLGSPSAFIWFLPYSHSSPLLPLLFPFSLQFSNWRHSPTEESPQNLNQDINHTRSMQVSLVFAAITLFAVLKHSSLFLPGLRTRWRHFGNWGHPTLLFFLNIALCPFSSPATSTEDPGWRNTGQWGNPWAGGPSLPLPQWVSSLLERNAAAPAAAESGKVRSLCKVTLLQQGTSFLCISPSQFFPWVAFQGLDPIVWIGWSSAAVFHGARNWGLSPLQLNVKNRDAGNLPLYSELIPEHLIPSALTLRRL